MSNLGCYETVEEVVEELKRCEQKCEILKRQVSSLEKELEIAKPLSSSESELKALKVDMESSLKRIQDQEQKLVKWTEKGGLVRAHLRLERENLKEIRTEMANAAIQNEGAMRMLTSLVVAKEKARIEAEKTHVANMAETEARMEQERAELLKAADTIRAENETLKSKQKAEAARYEQLLKEAGLSADDREDKLRGQIAEAVAAREEMKAAGLKASLKHSEERFEMEGAIAKTQKMVEELLKKREEVVKERDGAKAEAVRLKEQMSQVLAELRDAQTKLKITSQEQVRDSDLRLKLREVTEKVHLLEGEHEQELIRLNSEISRLKTACQELEGAASSSAGLAARLSTRNEELEKQIATARDGSKSQHEARQAQEERIASLEKLLSDEKVRVEEARRSVEALRKDWNEASELSKLGKRNNEALTSKVCTLEGELKAAQAAAAEALAEAVAAREGAEAGSAASAALAEMEATLAAKEEEMDGLRDTIRRECTERTEMLIEMSELRDQLQQQGEEGAAGGGGVGRGFAPPAMLRSLSSQESFMPGAVAADRLPHINKEISKDGDPRDDSWRKQVSSGKGPGRGGGRKRGQPMRGTMR